MSNPLDVFYVWPAAIERRRGANAHGDVYEAVDDSDRWKIRTTSDLVITTDGRQVATTATLTGPPTTRRVPVGSRVTLPTEFGETVGRVAAESLHDTGIPGVPAYYQIQLERPTVTS